eukprot:SM000221S06935  [mRNA]  locus=s221:68947:74861:+ [translate_table: standard]
MVGAWDPAHTVPMEPRPGGAWELGFVVPSDHEALAFKFVLQRDVGPPLLEDGPDRVLVRGAMDDATGPVATFPDDGATTDDGDAEMGLLAFPVEVTAQPVSPLALAASWRAYVHGAPGAGVARASSDLRPDFEPDELVRLQPRGSLNKELGEYEVPLPEKGTGGQSQYIADDTAEPRLVVRTSKAGGEAPIRRVPSRDRCVSIKDLVLLGQQEARPQRSPLSPKLEDDEADSTAFPLVDATVSPSVRRLATIQSDVSNLDLETSPQAGSPGQDESLPEAVGAVATAAVADRMLGPKERRRLAIVLVGLPARGKTFTAAKLTRYLRWLGHDTKHFNVGKPSLQQSSEFFRADNPEGVEARNEIAMLAMEDMLAWMEEGGQVGVFDATNTTKDRRNLLLRLAEGKCKVIFLETICNDAAVIEHNLREKIKKSPDYEHEPDPDLALADFKERLANYEKASFQTHHFWVYEPVDEGSYIKLIDMVSGNGQMQVNNISGYLPGRIVFFLVNTHTAPRPILLTRHGESSDNVYNRIGGDPGLSEAGEEYALKLSDFISKRLVGERTASIWTSTLQRTILTARHIQGFPKVQWRALDEINAGVCDGMTYQEIKLATPEEYNVHDIDSARKLDKLRYRYPRGESYLDVIQRLEPVIIELERQRSPVVVIAHQAVLRALYAYFMDKPLKEVPHIEMPLHTIIELTTGVSGVQEKRFKLMESADHPSV